MPETEAKDRRPDCPFPGANEREALILEFTAPGEAMPTDYLLARGLDETCAYLSDVLGREVTNPRNLIPEMTETDMRMLLSRYNVSGGISGLYLCDTGCNGGVTQVHSQSRYFNIELE